MMNSRDNMDQTNSRLSRDLDENSSSAVSKVTTRADQMMGIVHQGSILPDRSDFPRGIPEPLKAAMIKGQTEVIQVELDYFKKSLLQVRDSELKSLELSCEQHILKVQATNTLNAAKIVTDKVNPFIDEVNRMFAERMASLVRQLEDASKISYPKARELTLRGLEEELERSYQDFDRLRKKARSVIDAIT